LVNTNAKTFRNLISKQEGNENIILVMACGLQPVFRTRIIFNADPDMDPDPDPDLDPDPEF
jgi:hypothetical protein